MSASDADRCAGLAQAAGAEAVIFYAHRHDHLQLFTTPSQMAAIEALNLPILYLSEQPYLPPAELEATIRHFLTTLSSRASGGQATVSQ